MELRREILGQAVGLGHPAILSSAVHAKKAVEFMRRTRLLGQFRSMLDTPQVVDTTALVDWLTG